MECIGVYWSVLESIGVNWSKLEQIREAMEKGVEEEGERQ
jgi:hypothetical protein